MCMKNTSTGIVQVEKLQPLAGERALLDLARA